MVRRLILAPILVAAVLVAPPVARERLFCRWTGVEILPTDCQDEVPAETPSFVAERCCENRIQAPLPSGKVESGSVVLGAAPTIDVALSWFEAFQQPLVGRDEPPPRLRPPLSETRILLI